MNYSAKMSLGVLSTGCAGVRPFFAPTVPAVRTVETVLSSDHSCRHLHLTGSDRTVGTGADCQAEARGCDSFSSDPVGGGRKESLFHDGSSRRGR